MSTADPSTTTAPSPVVTAYRLDLAAAALGLIGVVASVVLLPQTIAAATREAQRAAAGQDTAGLDIAALAAGTAIGAVVLAAVVSIAFAVLTVVFARKMLRGRHWARVVLTVFAGLRLLGLIGLVGPGANAAVSAIGLLEIVAAVVAAVLTWLPASRSWFRPAVQPLVL